MSDKKIIIMDEGIDYDVRDKFDCIEAIFEEYIKSDVSMSEVLACIEIKGFSAEDVVDIYAECVRKSDSDTMIRIFSEFDDDVLDETFDSYSLLGV